MIFDKEGTTTTVHQENISINEFLKSLEEKYEKVQEEHLILNLFTFKKLTSGDILEFLEISKKHSKKNKSFVLVTDKVAFDDIPVGITVTPTLQEAKDIIAMEEIERDLGI